MAAISSPRRRERVVERDSVLRASIFDTALELGVADSSAVAKWMFSPVQEMDEDVEVRVLQFNALLAYIETRCCRAWCHPA